MPTKLTANGVSTTTTPDTRCFTLAIAHGERSTTNTTIAILTESYTPAWLIPSKSADNAVMNGSTRKSTTQNDITNSK